MTAADAAGISVALTAPGRELPTVILGNAEGAKYRYARRAGEAQSFLIDRNPDVPRAAAQWVDSVIIDVRSERVREVTITHADGEVVRISKASPELANFEVADVPDGPRALVSRRRERHRQRAARAQPRGRRARRGSAGGAGDASSSIGRSTGSSCA